MGTTLGEMTARLSEREAQVLAQVASGKSNKEVGTALGIAEGTVKVHLKAIFGKIGARNRVEAAMWARGTLGDPLLPIQRDSEPVEMPAD